MIACLISSSWYQRSPFRTTSAWPLDLLLPRNTSPTFPEHPRPPAWTLGDPWTEPMPTLGVWPKQEAEGHPYDDRLATRPRWATVHATPRPPSAIVILLHLVPTLNGHPHEPSRSELRPPCASALLISAPASRCPASGTSLAGPAVFMDDAATKLSDRTWRRCFSYCTIETSNWLRSNLNNEWQGRQWCFVYLLALNRFSHSHPEDLPRKCGPPSFSTLREGTRALCLASPARPHCRPPLATMPGSPLTEPMSMQCVWFR